MTSVTATPEVEALVSEALKLRATNKHEYLDELHDIDEKFPGCGMVIHLIAHTEWELRQYASGVKHAKILIQMDANDESASLTLFHCLWAKGDYHEALREMERFQDISHSDDYKQFEDWVKKWGEQRANFDFAELTRFGESDTNVVTTDPPQGIAHEAAEENS